MAASEGHSGTSSSRSEEVAEEHVSNAEESESSSTNTTALDKVREVQRLLIKKANDGMDVNLPQGSTDKHLRQATSTIISGIEDSLFLQLFDLLEQYLLQKARKETRRRERWLRMQARHQFKLQRASRAASTQSTTRKRKREDNERQAISKLQHAIAGRTDHKQQKWPHLKEDEELRPRYFDAYQGTVQNRLMKQVKRWQNQRERYGMENARNWRSVLDLLDQATPDGETRYKRRMETVTIEDGLQAQWKKNAGEVVLELMQKTGAHLQAMPDTGKEGTFRSVSLWGTPAQNEHARLLLYKYVEAADDQRKPVNTYALKAEVAHDRTAAAAVFEADRKEATDTAYWREQEMMEEAETELLEDALGDITNAPSREPPPVHAVWAPSTLDIRTRPEAWNQLTFAAYVDALVTPISRLAQRKLYGPLPAQSYQGHVQHMTAELVRTFTSRESRSFVSAAALDTAMRFFLKHNDFQAVRKVFIRLEDRQFEFTASNFDRLLEVAAREESVPNFIYALRLMIRKGMRPTAATWTAFHLLMARRFPLETNIVTEAMRRKGFFSNIDTVKAVAAGNADRAMAAHIALGKSVDDFMLSCEARYGEPDVWLSARFVHKVARVLLERGRTEDAMNVVRQLEALAREKGRQGVTVATLNTFLASSMRDGNMKSALAYLRIFTPLQGLSPDSSIDPAEPSVAPVGRYADDALAIQPDQISLAILFRMAWYYRYYNIARVLWRHARASGKVRFRMQDAVHRSLSRQMKSESLGSEEGDLRATKKKKTPLIGVRPLWTALAGKFVVGLDTKTVGEGSESIEGSPTADTVGRDRNNINGDVDLADLLTTQKPTSEPNELASAKLFSSALPRHILAGMVPQKQHWYQARALIAAEMDEAGSMQPENHLLRDLERAWRLDVLWKEEGLGKPKRVLESAGRGEGGQPLQDAVLETFDEMMVRGVRVPMVVGDVAGVRDAKGLVRGRHRPTSQS